MNKKLSIIIPAYNEEQRIQRTLQDYLSYFAKIYKTHFELIVVLNGCTDNTLRVVNTFKRYTQLRIINIPEAIGKGGAIIEGFKHAKGELIGYTDADGATPANEFAKLIPYLKKHDGAIASRWITGATTNPPQPLKRRIASRTFNLLVRILFFLNLRDTQCGSKLFTQNTLQKIQKALGITRWAFDIDLLYQCKRRNLSIVEVPINWEDKSGSKLNVEKAALEMFLAVIRLRLLYSPFRFIISLYDATIRYVRKLTA